MELTASSSSTCVYQHPSTTCRDYLDKNYVIMYVLCFLHMYQRRDTKQWHCHFAVHISSSFSLSCWHDNPPPPVYIHLNLSLSCFSAFESPFFPWTKRPTDICNYFIRMFAIVVHCDARDNAGSWTLIAVTFKRYPPPPSPR